jgi:hypothetical protein
LYIAEYQTVDQQNFIDMMNAMEKGDLKKASDIYEVKFLRTDMVDFITKHFPNPVFDAYRQEMAFMDFSHHPSLKEEKKGSLSDIISTNKDECKSLIGCTLENVPKKDLNTLLSILPEIETTCSKKDIP